MRNGKKVRKAMEKREVERPHKKKWILIIFMFYMLFQISLNSPLSIHETQAQSMSGEGGRIEVYCDGKPCNNNYVGGSIITCIAIPDSDQEFSHWSGMCNHTDRICQFMMPNRSLEVTAHFRSKTKKKSM